MESIRKWFYKPKKGDRSLLAQFFYADDELNAVAAELDSFDGKKDPQRCTALVNHLRQCQDKVLTICIKIMDELIPGERASRDFRVKFPDDVIQDNLAGQLWFGAECLSAGSSIMNREAESGAMRPLARALTKSLEKVRSLLRDASLCSDQTPPCLRNLISSLCTFDHLLAEFELRYVSAMVPVKTAHEYELQQLVVVLFSETLQRALAKGLLSQEMVDDYDPALMFTIPRLAIVGGLLFYPCVSPLSLDQSASNMSDMFRPFRSLLIKIRELLWTLSKKELATLERMLCSSDDVKFDDKLTVNNQHLKSHDSSDEDSESLSSSTTELVMEKNVTTIEHCSRKGFPSSSPHDLLNNNPSTKKFESNILKKSCDLQNNDLKSPMPSSTADECIESSSVPDADLTECLATATEALTEILVKTNLNIESENLNITTLDSNGNNSVVKNPNVSSSSTQTDCPPSSSYHVCCCKEWNCWKSSGEKKEICNGSAQCQTNLCCNHKRKKSNNDIKQENKKCDCSVSRYNKNWRELRKVANKSTNVLCRVQTCNRNSKTVIKNHEVCSSCSSCTTSSADESDESKTDSSTTDSSCNFSLRRQKARAKFRSDEDLLHRLFVCISGVADQLQTNFAGDLRNILKAVFLMSNSSSNPDDNENTEFIAGNNNLSINIENGEEAIVWRGDIMVGDVSTITLESPPPWIPDNEAPLCMSCKAIFTVVRRRHHCRNCGKVFCSRCSSNSVPLPRFGHLKPVRVCNRCFIYQVTPFTLDSSIGPVPIMMHF